MKRWVVSFKAGKVKPALAQDTGQLTPEYISSSRYFAFVLAVDELGAFVRAQQLLAEAKQ